MVELTLSAAEAERVAPFLERILDRLSAGERARSVLSAMPAIESDLPTSIRLRWIDVNAEDPAGAESQVVAWFAALTAPLQPVAIAASHVEEHSG